jgi:hypothetical protein
MHLIASMMICRLNCTHGFRRPLFWFRNSPHEQAMAPPQRGPGTTWFTQSRGSRAHAPVVGADGHLWMEGINVQLRDEVPLGFWIDPTSIRVAPLDDGAGVVDPIPTYVPLSGTPATLTCVPQTGRLVPAATAMLSVPILRELYGDVVEAATIARDLLAPMASQPALRRPPVQHPSPLRARLVPRLLNPS